MSDEKAEIEISRLAKMKPEHAQFEKLWGDCAEFSLLYHEGMNMRSDRTSISEKVFDETAVLAGSFFDCALHGMLTNPAGSWFGWEAEEPDLMEYDEVRVFLQEAAKTAHHILSNTNYHMAMAKEYTHIRTFGTAPIFCGEDINRGAFFYPASIGNTYCAEDYQGVVDTVVRVMEFTARVAAQKFGEKNLPDKIKKEIGKDGNKEKKFTFLHTTCPREDRNIRSKKNTDMPFASVYVNIDEEALISEGGFPENPWATPRWWQPWRSVYGGSPAMNVIATIKMLNDMEQTNLIAGHKMIEPSLQVPEELQGKRVKQYTGGLTYFDSKKGKIEPINTVLNISFALEMADRKRKTIEEGFFKHVLQLPLDADMTATEVLKRIEEQVRILGPMVGRLFFELLNQQLDRIYAIFSRAGYFGEIPDILKGQKVKVQYLSSIARAQKIAEAKAALQGNEIMAPYLQVFPDLLDNLKRDDMYRDTMIAVGTPQKWLTDQEVRDETRAIRQKMEQEQAAIAQLQQAGEAGQAIRGAMA